MNYRNYQKNNNGYYDSEKVSKSNTRSYKRSISDKKSKRMADRLLSGEDQLTALRNELANMVDNITTKEPEYIWSAFDGTSWNRI